MDATDIGGTGAQLGSRLIEGTASKVAGGFFAKLGSIVDPGRGPATPEAAK